MRKGVNPAKMDPTKNLKKLHRVIIPVYIPNLSDSYFSQALDVLKICLESINNTIDHSTTDVSVISDGSCAEVVSYLSGLSWIDRLVIHKTNKGKVYSVMSETRACYESLITITDADVHFYAGWWSSTLEIFTHYKKAGAVSPLPMMSKGLTDTSSIFYDMYLRKGIKYGKVVSDEDCQLYLKGLTNTILLDRNKSLYSWKEKQYYLEQGPKAILGAGHFVTTYKRELLLFNTSFPSFKFKDGYELNFLDTPIDKQGFYRLSTQKAYVYHLGNRVEDNYESIIQGELQESKEEDYTHYVRKRTAFYFLRSNVFKILKRLKKL